MAACTVAPPCKYMRLTDEPIQASCGPTVKIYCKNNICVAWRVYEGKTPFSSRTACNPESCSYYCPPEQQ